MAADVRALLDDLDLETAQLVRWLRPLDDDAWRTPTPAEGWTVHDQITHLTYFDVAATVAAVEPDRFRAEHKPAAEQPESITEVMVDRYRAVVPAQLFAWFRGARVAMTRTFATVDPSARLPWYGPDMSLASAVTARIMETWAHGQDVADALGVDHEPTAALRHVAHIGVRTFGNSFLARGLDVPDADVRVELSGPDGETWEWGSADAVERVEGDALDFCLVVTQRRHRDDTALVVTGPIANQWIDIAQAFAGPPGPGRPPAGMTTR